VEQGALEGSNVELASELSELIQAQRVFSLASRALQTADNMEGLANNIRT
jgi:flagellar basal-body rod protein FlgG